VVERYCEFVLEGALNPIAEARVQILVVDSAVLAGGSIAQRLRLPFVTVSLSPLFFPADEMPPPFCGWRPRHSSATCARNRRANQLLRDLLGNAMSTLGRKRRSWDLSPLKSFDETFSKAAIIVQMPREFDFEQAVVPESIVYSGPFVDRFGRVEVEFPWQRLDGRPLIYVSMGTVQNHVKRIFQTILSSCSALSLQAVVSLGGGVLQPDDFDPLPDNAFVVHFAPQLDVIARSAIVVCHGGMNTVMEALSMGKPLIAIPIADDQPGVAARIRNVGAGLTLSARSFSASEFRGALERVLYDRRYRDSAERMKSVITKRPGVTVAADVIERALTATRFISPNSKAYCESRRGVGEEHPECQ
jgi:zeaxanthin glucosyltransferase